MLRIFAGRRWLVVPLAFCALMLAACSGSRTQDETKSGPTKQYTMRGTVLGVDVSGHTATIKHGDIEGFMKAMTMGYPVKDASELKTLSVGEPITATVYVNGDDFWVGNIQKDTSVKP